MVYDTNQGPLGSMLSCGNVTRVPQTRLTGQDPTSLPQIAFGHCPRYQRDQSLSGAIFWAPHNRDSFRYSTNHTTS